MDIIWIYIFRGYNPFLFDVPAFSLSKHGSGDILSPAVLFGSYCLFRHHHRRVLLDLPSRRWLFLLTSDSIGGKSGFHVGVIPSDMIAVQVILWTNFSFLYVLLDALRPSQFSLILRKLPSRSASTSLTSPNRHEDKVGMSGMSACSMVSFFKVALIFEILHYLCSWLYFLSYNGSWIELWSL